MLFQAWIEPTTLSVISKHINPWVPQKVYLHCPYYSWLDHHRLIILFLRFLLTLFHPEK